MSTPSNHRIIKQNVMCGFLGIEYSVGFGVFFLRQSAQPCCGNLLINYFVSAMVWENTPRVIYYQITIPYYLKVPVKSQGGGQAHLPVS